MSRHALTQAQTLKLAAYIQAEYTKSALSLPAFAEKATADLGFLINRHNVNSLREALELPTNRAYPEVAGRSRIAALEAEIHKLQTAFNSLERRVDTYFSGGAR